MSKEKIKARFQEIGVIHKEPVRLRSGLSSTFYCDIKKSFGYPDILDLLAEEVGKNLEKNVTCIAASGYGGLPLAAVVAGKFNLKFVLVRDSVKKHGKGGQIDGYIPTKSDKVAIVDDVLTTGSSIRETYAILKKNKARVAYAVVIVKRGEAKLPISCKHIFTIAEII